MHFARYGLCLRRFQKARSFAQHLVRAIVLVVVIGAFSSFAAVGATTFSHARLTASPPAAAGDKAAPIPKSRDEAASKSRIERAIDTQPARTPDIRSPTTPGIAPAESPETQMVRETWIHYFSAVGEIVAVIVTIIVTFLFVRLDIVEHEQLALEKGIAEVFFLIGEEASYIEWARENSLAEHPSEYFQKVPELADEVADQFSAAGKYKETRSYLDWLITRGNDNSATIAMLKKSLKCAAIYAVTFSLIALVLVPAATLLPMNMITLIVAWIVSMLVLAPIPIAVVKLLSSRKFGFS